MSPEDLHEFTELLDGTCALQTGGKYSPNDTSTAIFFRTLAPYPIEAVRAAFAEHVRRSEYSPKPSDLLKLLAANDGRPGPEEAWAIAQRSQDERDTVIWTGEMGKAWTVARPVLISGDEVGARVAFREAYNRLVDEARQRMEPVRWQALMGHDPARRVEALTMAQKQGLPVEGAAELMSDALAALPAPRGGPDLLLPAPEHESELAASSRAALKVLTDSMRGAPVSRDSEAKSETAELRAQATEKAMAYAREHGIVMNHPPLRMATELRGEFVEAP
jgi:hypothetical protein